jgi:serine/threonine-protein kinase
VPRPEDRVGTTLNGKWAVEALLAMGGMGAVYAAVHRNGRKAAIKVLLPRFARDPEVRKRFMREGYVANKIEHPGAVAILDDDIAEDGAPYLVMERLEGESLSEWLARVGGVLPPTEVLAIAGQVLEVLAIAHENGIVHRDIKPGNVFVTRSGHAKVLDFGLARIRDGLISLTPTADGTIMGTVGYMAPEQARGATAAVDARSDLFSVGALMYRALSGRRVHERPSPIEMTQAAMREPVAPIATVMPGVAPVLAAAVDRAVAFGKEARWQSATEMFEGLRAAYQEASRGAPPRRTPRLSAESIDVSFDTDPASSLVIDVAFGDAKADLVARERQRTREIIEGLSTMSVVVDPEAPKGR